MKHKTIKQALQNVADHPQMDSTEMIALPVHELVCRTLFEIANNPMNGKRGSQARANVARKIIFERMVGSRAAGSTPVRSVGSRVQFKDLTGGSAE